MNALIYDECKSDMNTNTALIVSQADFLSVPQLCV